MNLISDKHNKKVYRDGDRLIKIFDDSYPQSKVLKEAFNQTIANEIGISVPRLIEVCKIDGQWAIVSEYIEGTTLHQLLKANVNNKEKYDEYLNLFVETQLKIIEETTYSLPDLTDRLQRSICSTSMDAVTRYALHEKVSQMSKHNNVCHGDLVPINILVSNEGKPYIIDWSHSSKGNPYFDLATTYIQLKIKDSVIDVEEYLKLIEEKSDYSIEEIKRWIPIVSASLSGKQRLQDEKSDLIDIFLSENF